MMAAGDNSGANDSEGPLRVLLIDDSRSNEIAPLLEAATSVSFETTRVHDVEAGLQRLVENQFDAVLLDLSLEESKVRTLLPRPASPQRLFPSSFSTPRRTRTSR